jgi:hypothetical protein
VKPDFCKALEEDDRASLRAILNPVLARLDPKANREESFGKIQQWLAAHECVASVEIIPGELRSKPPIKQFAVQLKRPVKPGPRSIGVLLSPGGFEFHFK